MTSRYNLRKRPFDQISNQELDSKKEKARLEKITNDSNYYLGDLPGFAYIHTFSRFHVNALKNDLIAYHPLRAITVYENEIGTSCIPFLEGILVPNTTVRALYLGPQHLRIEENRSLQTLFTLNTTISRLTLEISCIMNTGSDLGIILAKSDYLTELDLTFTCKDKRFLSGFSSVFEQNTTLQKLTLRYFKSEPPSLKKFCRSLTKNQALTSLNLPFNHFPENQMNHLFKALTQNNTLKTLNLDLVHLTISNAQQLSNTLSCNTGLTHLYLKKCGITTSSIQLLGQALSINSNLQLINLEKNFIGLSTIEHLFVQLKNNKSLTDLNLAKCGNWNAGILDNLRDYLLQNHSLTKLNLKDNCIQNIGFRNIFETLSINSTLKSLDLSKNDLTSNQDPLSLDNMLLTINYLSELRLSECRPSRSLYDPLSQLLSNNTTLTTLDLSYNIVTGAFASQIFAALKKNTTLTNLDIRTHIPDQIDSENLISMLVVNTTLKNLYHDIRIWTHDTIHDYTILEQSTITRNLSLYDLLLHELGDILEFDFSLAF